MDRRVPEAVWQNERIRELVEEYLAGQLDPQEGFDFLTEVVEDRIQLVEEHAASYGVLGEERVSRQPASPPQRNSAETQEADPSSEPKIAAMLRAMSEFYADLAHQHPDVLLFRKKALGNKSLEPDEANAFLTSRAARLLTLEQFIKWGVPVVGHTAKLDAYDHGQDKEEIDHRATLRLDPPGITKSVRYAHDPRGDPNTRCRILSTKTIAPPNQGPAGMPLLPLVRGDYLDPPLLWPGSVVDELYRLSEGLADQFDWPSTEAAAWFVLTREAPTVRALEARWVTKGGHGSLSPQWRIRLTIPPWLPAEEVARIYRRMQGQIVSGKNELPKPRALEVARFVWEQERLNKFRRPSWPLLLERWNKKLSIPRKRRDKFGTYNNFRTYCMRGVDAVIRLNFTWPQQDKRNRPASGPVQELDVIAMTSLSCRIKDAPARADREGR